MEERTSTDTEVKRALQKIRQLVHLDTDAIGAYDAAMKRCSPQVADKLGEFRADHQRHVKDLNEKIEKLGGEPIGQTSDLKGSVLKGTTAGFSFFGLRGALMAMVANEELTSWTYEWAKRAQLPPDVRELLQRNYEDELRHLSWCKETLRSRVARPKPADEARP